MESEQERDRQDVAAGKGKRRKKSPLRQLGWDVEGRIVMGGLFEMADQMGFPLVESLLECERRGWCPGLGDYATSARRAGWSWDKINLRVTQAGQDAGWDQDAQDEVTARLMLMERYENHKTE